MIEKSRAGNCMDVSGLMRVHETLDFLSSRGHVYTPNALYQCCHRKQIPHIRCLGKLYFEREALEAWMKSKTEIVYAVD
jgi:hypothetical protein